MDKNNPFDLLVEGTWQDVFTNLGDAQEAALPHIEAGLAVTIETSGENLAKQLWTYDRVENQWVELNEANH